jgi:hypothetical protein
VIKGAVVLKRGPGQEYVNGYNAVIMATFKCNHDIQIIFGGKDARNKIYYCCKYVAKSQKFMDCTSAVALASHQRRILKEAELVATSSPIDASRRLVASMTYTFTNKQEVAGPLAALYILSGSCSFTSHDTVRLPLGEVLNQLDG